MEIPKKVSFFGKQISVVALALLATAGLASAGLLTYYGMITGTATVHQSLVISKDGQNWLECTGGTYNNCNIIYDATEITAGDTKDFNQVFYIKNNLPVAGTWDYVNFKWVYKIPKNLFDGLTSLKVRWATYSAGTTEPSTCDHETSIPLTGWTCDENTCTLEVSDKLGEGMIQKFCGTTIGLNPATIPGTYSLSINIVPA